MDLRKSLGRSAHAGASLADAVESLARASLPKLLRRPVIERVFHRFGMTPFWRRWPVAAEIGVSLNLCTSKRSRRNLRQEPLF